MSTDVSPEVKSILQSKTFWFNVVSLSLAYASYLPPQYAAVVVAVGNIALRFVSNGPVNLTGSK